MGNPAALLNPWSLLTATAGLIAFHIGLYTLVGRERKSPYVINAIFPVFLMCLLVAIFTLTTFVLPLWLSEYILLASVLVLTLSFVLSLIIVYRTTIRFMYFVDSMHFRHLPLIRHLRRIKASHSSKSSFAHTSSEISDELKQEVLQILSDAAGQLSSDEQTGALDSIALQIANQKVGSDVMARLCRAFLSQEFFVQYVVASRHPIEFVAYLRGSATGKEEWRGWAKNIVVIDAYSPHFAFIDSIYAKKDRELDGMDVERVTSKMTYAGIHSASSKAFNLFEHNSKDTTRKPTLVIYEGTYALTDLESVEQYRIFIRHVIPSEKMWGGMLTVFLEPVQSANDWDLLRSYSSIACKIERNRPELIK